MLYTKKEKQEITKKIANFLVNLLPTEWTGDRLPPAEDTMEMTKYGKLLNPLVEALIELNEKLYNSGNSPECAVCPHNKKEKTE